MPDLTDEQAAVVFAGSSKLPAEFGNYNSMPPNVEWITESEWLHAFGFGQKAMHFRQVKLPSVSSHGELKEETVRRIVEGDAREVFCNVYFWTRADYSGVGFVTHYNGHCTEPTTDHWAQWFKFYWCKHEYETTISKMCYWEGKCKKCGYVSVVDSSD